MNQETIENHIKNLSKADFDKVVILILNKIFCLGAIDVDGKGDGGSDYRCFVDDGNNKVVAIQKTVQESNWVSKVLRDAEKVKDKYGYSRFFFLTSRSRSATDLHKLESDIFVRYGMNAKCLGATEIAGLIVENRLLGDFAYAIDLPLDVSLSHRPDQREIMLHVYFSLSEDRRDLQNEIYESAIKSQLVGQMLRDDLLDKVLSFLGAQESRRSNISSRIDYLLVKNKIQRVGDFLALSKESITELQVANGVYVKDMEQLLVSQVDLLVEYGGAWESDKAEKAALLLARLFVDEQLKVAKNSSLSFSMTGFGDGLSDAKTDLHELIKTSGVLAKDVEEVFEKMVDLARTTSLIKKLTSAVVYVAIEDSKATRAAAILGATSWKDVKVILDASVVIPYICTVLYGCSSGRFSVGSNEAIGLLKKNGARLCVPWYYLNECASHLVAARQYCGNMVEFEDSFAYSVNGYVSHYYKLKESGVNVPDTLSDFIKNISAAALLDYSDMRQSTRRVMQQLQPLFADYGVIFEQIDAFDPDELREIQMEYTFMMRELHRKKPANLIDHDVRVLTHIKREYSENNQKIICLTWDAVMIRLGKDMCDQGWVVSPVDAADLISSKMGLTEAKLLSLAVNIAKTHDEPKDLGARIIDRAVRLSGKKMADWEYRQKVRAFRDEAISRIDLTRDGFDLDDFDKETDKFLRNQGVISDATIQREDDY